MNFIKDSDESYGLNFPLLIGTILFDLVVSLVTIREIITKYYLLDYLSLGYCIFGGQVANCPDEPQPDQTTPKNNVDDIKVCTDGLDSNGSPCVSSLLL